MILSELWNHYEGDVDISGLTLNLLKEYLAKQSDRLKPRNLGPRIRFVLSRFAYEETYLSSNPSI
ncbi:hypothetical protein [Paenibacillus sp. 2003]|uniref:hypothetical protein n=1 Tax=Paenibacillus TaxID=44249 RepID=UPI0028561174|nr:hypothetical protein [Paenibacillus sp. 2003]MDR6717244.1 hypothetical protein [Paenibacillus sp. 2003]